MRKQTNNFDLSGRVLSVGGVERISDKFSKRVLIMEVFDGKYGNEMPFEFINESIDQIKDVRADDWVTINFAMSARKSDKDGTVRRYVTLKGISCYKE